MRLDYGSSSSAWGELTCTLKSYFSPGRKDSHINYFFHICSVPHIFAQGTLASIISCLLSCQVYYWLLSPVSYILFPQILHFKIKFFNHMTSLSRQNLKRNCTNRTCYTPESQTSRTKLVAEVWGWEEDWGRDA